MNLKLPKLPTNVTRSIGKTSLKVQKHLPEILFGIGTVMGVASTVSACKSTLRVDEVLAEEKENLDKIKGVHNGEIKTTEEYSDADYRKDLSVTYARCAVKTIKLYGPSIIFGIISISCFAGSHRILNKRNASITALYSASKVAYDNYRKNVIAELGDEADKRFKYGIKAGEIEEKVVNEKGKEKTVKKPIDYVGNDIESYSEYARFFDESCREYSDSPEYNLKFLKDIEQHMNDRLKANGFVFLNEVYKELGIPRTQAGQRVGWIYDPDNPNGDNYISFDIFNTFRERNRAFVNGYEPVILLDFNVDGEIWNMI